MDERSVVPFALAAGEVAGSLALILAIQDPVERSSWVRFSGNHALFTIGFWVLIAIGGYMLGPAVWRKRRSLKSKLKFLGTIWLIGVVAENTLLINITADVTGGVGWGAVPSYELWLRTIAWSLAYWGILAAWYLLTNRRRDIAGEVSTFED